MSRKKRAFEPAVNASVEELTAVKSPLGSAADVPTADVPTAGVTAKLPFLGTDALTAGASFGADGTESYPDAGVPQIDPATGQPLSSFAQLMTSAVTDNDTRAWSKLLGQPMDRLSVAKLNYTMASTAVASGGVGLVLGLGLGALGMALWTKFRTPPSPVKYIPVETARNWARGVKIQ